MTVHERINDLLVNLFNQIWDLEEKAIIVDEFEDISSNHMHIIEAIGLGVESTMSAVAKKLGITAGSLTTSVNNLVNKKYVLRLRSQSDRRVVYISLTEKGGRAFRHHEDFHKKMTEAVVQSLSEDETSVLLKSLEGLSNFFYSYREEV